MDLRDRAKAMGAGGYLGIVSIMSHNDGEGMEESLQDLCAEAMATALTWALAATKPQIRAEVARLRKP